MTMLKLTLRLGFIAATLGLSLAAGVGCSRNQAVQTTMLPLEADAAAPNERASTVCRLLYWSVVTTLNPHAGQRIAKTFEAARIVYEPLASYDASVSWLLFWGAEIPTLRKRGLDGRW